MRKQQSSISKISSLGIQSKQYLGSEKSNAKDSSSSSISLHYELQKSRQRQRYMNKQNMEGTSKMDTLQNIMNKQYGIREYFKQRKQKASEKELEGSLQKNWSFLLKGYRQCRYDTENMLAEVENLIDLMRKEEVIKQIRTLINEKIIENKEIRKGIQKNQKLITDRGIQRQKNQIKIDDLREMLRQKAKQYNDNKQKLFQLSEEYMKAKSKSDSFNQERDQSRYFCHTIKPHNETLSNRKKGLLSKEYFQKEVEGLQKVTRSSQSSLNKKISRLKVQNETEISKIINSFEFPMRMSIDYSQQYQETNHKNETFQKKYKVLLKQRIKLLNNSINEYKQQFEKKVERVQREKNCIKQTIEVLKLGILNFQNKNRKMRASWVRKNFFSLPTERFKSISVKSSALQMNPDQIPTNKYLTHKRLSNKSRSNSKHKFVKIAWNKHLLETATEEVLEQWQESPQKEDRYNIIHQFETGEENDESNLVY